MRRALLVLCATTALTLVAAQGQTPLPSPQQQPQLRNPPVIRIVNYTYTATTASAVRRTGAISAGGVTWQCVQSYCTATGPWPTPGVSSCQALAREVGRIVAYGHSSARLNAAQLSQCNTGPSLTPPAPPPPPAPPSPPPPPPSSGVTITTPELSIVGGSTVRAPDVGPMVISTPELFIVGGAVATTPDIPPVTMTTPELSIVGR